MAPTTTNAAGPRTYLESLRWDYIQRLDNWLIRVAIADPDALSARARKRLQRIGAWFLMAMAARGLQPGCKFDYMLVLEGPQGCGKSSVLAALAGEQLTDTSIVTSDKEAIQALQGKWLCEIAELEAMTRQEATSLKAFICSTQDVYRASYAPQALQHPREVVFVGTCNQLPANIVAGAGYRRFWCVNVTRRMEVAWLLMHRDQLFAEAVHRLRLGEAYFPQTAEELQLLEGAE
jgi:predicted P-loop ATPase